MILFEEIYDDIVNCLIQHKGASIQEIYSYLKTDISLPNFYKVIGKLIDKQIVIKENGKLYFHNRWIFGFLEISDKLKDNYLDTATDIMQLKEGTAVYYESTSIESLDGVRGDRMISINRLYGGSESTYVYQAHPYYSLGMHDTEMAFFSQENKISDVYFLAGNCNFLDKYGTDLYKNIGVKSLAVDTLPFLKDGYCVSVIGDYIFEVLYPQEISDYFKIFFDSIKDMEAFNPNLFHRIFEMKANFKLTLRRDPSQALQIKKVFQKTFLKTK